MASALIITLPAGDRALQQQVRTGLSAAADVRSAPGVLGLEEVKLVVETLNSGLGVAANIATIVTFLLMLKEQRRQGGGRTGVSLKGPDGPPIALDDADEELLRKLLGANPSDGGKL